MHAGIDGPCRDVAPCKGCARKEKRPGCHDRCKDYKDWKTVIEQNRKAEQAYKAKPFSKII